MIDPSYPVFLWQFTCLGDLAPCSYVFSKSLFPYFLHTICDLETATWCHIHLIFCEAKRVGVHLQRKQECMGYGSHTFTACALGVWVWGDKGAKQEGHFYSISTSTPSPLLLISTSTLSPLLLHLHCSCWQKCSRPACPGEPDEIFMPPKSASSCQEAALELVLEWYPAAERFFCTKT